MTQMATTGIKLIFASGLRNPEVHGAAQESLGLGTGRMHMPLLALLNNVISHETSRHPVKQRQPERPQHIRQWLLFI